jgi:hypothetical protein
MDIWLHCWIGVHPFSGKQTYKEALALQANEIKNLQQSSGKLQVQE